MVGKTISHYKILEKLGEGGTCSRRQGRKLLMIGKQISHYKVLEELGRGGMGVVYKGSITQTSPLHMPSKKFFLPPRRREVSCSSLWSTSRAGELKSVMDDGQLSIEDGDRFEEVWRLRGKGHKLRPL